MRAMTVRDVECLSARETITICPFDLGRQIQRFQRYIETSDWDERLVRYLARFDKTFLHTVVFLGLSILLSWLLYS
ncbi:MAG: hypothetical protein A4E66_02432 [Syntrophus sp. PtaB.Bin001]|nr:MAG: hypothetical protein A4E66_02432 [Syntrophus sp. PtaB.Bin001]